MKRVYQLEFIIFERSKYNFEIFKFSNCVYKAFYKDPQETINCGYLIRGEKGSN
jgi:hypothetical protein